MAGRQAVPSLSAWFVGGGGPTFPEARFREALAFSRLNGVLQRGCKRHHPKRHRRGPAAERSASRDGKPACGVRPAEPSRSGESLRGERRVLRRTRLQGVRRGGGGPQASVSPIYG